MTRMAVIPIGLTCSAVALAMLLWTGSVAAKETGQTRQSVDLVAGPTRADDVPSKDEIRKAVSGAPAANVFWTGRTGSCSGEADSVKNLTEDFARKRGKKTLEMRLRDSGINMPVWHNADPRSKPMWRLASREFAAQSSDQAWVVEGTCVREHNTWQSNELPALKATGKINCIWEISSTDLAHEKLLWSASDLSGLMCKAAVGWNVLWGSRIPSPIPR